ncbi:hypothetical protein CDD81_6991 [Ophiocordyceps australis]|uniref:Uncharacterized protein n=1 Tax=Ophiocordyceps australis TaxID=1399860 RepID=A0A2C5YFN1_9HYPO|nr:hypothetical protein CDD81_6991 [Ophiocordyceps australis]
MASDVEAEARPTDSSAAEGDADSLQGPSTPCQPYAPSPWPSPSPQEALASTEVATSPIAAAEPSIEADSDNGQDDGEATEIPSSLTPPPSTQVPEALRHSLSQSQSQSQNAAAPVSPPDTMPNHAGHGRDATQFATPSPQQMADASAQDLRCMLQACISANSKLKMQVAHHRLQYHLLSLQADEASKRASVEHDMARREVDMVRQVELSRHVKREFGSPLEILQSELVEMKMLHEEALEEKGRINHRLAEAVKLLRTKANQVQGLTEDREFLLKRIRENRERIRLLCSPGGLFHSAMTQRQTTTTASRHPDAQRHAQHHTRHHSTQRPPQIPRQQQLRQTPSEARLSTPRAQPPQPAGHGLSALLQAMSQDSNGAASSHWPPHRAAQRNGPKHNRNAQSLSSLPTTPVGRGRDSRLLPSVDLVPHTEPRPRLSQHQQLTPTTPMLKRASRRKSRESTISVDDNEELARQAMESAVVAQASGPPCPHTAGMDAAQPKPRRQEEQDDAHGHGSARQATQASHTPSETLQPNSAGAYGSPGGDDASLSPRESGPVASSVRMQTELLSAPEPIVIDKRKLDRAVSLDNGIGVELQSPLKRKRVGSTLDIGLGIQYDGPSSRPDA